MEHGKRAISKAQAKALGDFSVFHLGYLFNLLVKAIIDETTNHRPRYCDLLGWLIFGVSRIS